MWVRLYAEMIGDEVHEQNKNECIVMHLNIDENRIVDNKTQSFGYIQEYENGSYLQFPFILQPNSGYFDFGGWRSSETGDYSTNILYRSLDINEVFTLTVCHNNNQEDYTYRIMRVTMI